MSFIDQYQKVFILGLGGSGMSSIAKFLSQKGHEVSGYDQRQSYITNLLANDGIESFHDLKSMKYEKSVLFIVSSAVNLKNTFLVDYLNEENVLTRPQFLKKISEEFEIIGVTGTHGKTSTTALLSHIFHFNKIDVSYIFGGVTSFNGIGGHYGTFNKMLILETDEAFNTFEELKISSLLVTNIDNDHLDHYGSFENLVKAFHTVIRNVSNNKILNYEDEELKNIKSIGTVFYGSSESSDYKIDYPDTFKYKKKSYKIKTKLIGNHFVSNIVGAIAIAETLGIEINDSLLAIEHFNGVKRRTEFIGEFNNIKIYDDYGHHSTEIKATISALKEKYNGRLFTIFQPHRFTRTRDNFETLKKSLEISDITYVTDIFPAGEDPIPGIHSSKFESNKIKYIKSPRMLLQLIKNEVTPGDIVLTIGAGDITLLGPQILRYIKNE